MSTEITLHSVLPLLESGRDLVLSANGSSMIPSIVRGDRVHITSRVRDEDVRVGEIVLAVDAQGRYFLHRVVQVQPELVTRGDACSDNDEPLAAVVGVVTRIEKTWRSRLRRFTLWLKGIERAPTARSFI